jgi:hypothetical protein
MESGDNMASSFWSGEFYFDNIRSTDKKVCIVDVNDNSILKQIGNTFSISMEKDTAFRGNPLYRETEITTENIVLQLCRTDGKTWTNNNIREITEWLFQDTFKKFIPNDIENQGYTLFYYVKAIEYKKFLNPNMEGYIEITFQPYDAYIYATPTYSLSVSGGSTTSISNISNVNKIYYPKIRVINLGNKENVITINNLTTGNTLSIKGIEQGKDVTIDCAIGSVLDAEGKNRFDVLQNFDFIGLSKGENRISLSSNCSIQFTCEFPMVI